MEQCKEKLSIAMFGQKRIPSREGGVEIVVEELCTRMVAQGHNVTCYNRGGHHVSGSEYDSKRLKEYKGIKLKTVPTIEKKGLAAVSSSFFAALCCAFGKYDIVHIHAEGPAFFAWLPKMFGKKVIVTIHGLDWQREKWKSGFGSKFIHQGEKNAVKYADEIIVLSKGVQDYFEKTYGRKTVFIPNGVSNHIEREPQIIKNKFGLGKDEYILFLGRLVPEKGIKYLIEAFKQVDTEKKLVIAGGSSDTSEFENEMKELAKEDKRILFTGFVQGQELEELYSNAYVYVLPSDLEGMCNRYKAPSKPNEEISIETIKKLPKMYFTNITGGEPFIRTDLKDIVRELYKKSDRIVISTNGFFTDRIVDLAKEFPQIGIRISIEGLEKTNNEIRGLENGFQRGYSTLMTNVW